jgi:TonB family protein
MGRQTGVFLNTIGMFVSSPAPGLRTWKISLLVSLAAHLVVLVVICRRPPAIFVSPSLIAKGDFGKVTLIYSPSGPATPKMKTRRTQDSLTFLKSPRFAPRNTGSRTPQKEPARPQPEATTSVRAGAPYGSVFEGPASGPDVRPAIPTVFPDPPVSRSEAPAGVEGDIVVEITIDESGVVVETKLLKGIGYGIEDKVIATLRNWRFRPATKDGAPIPSKQDYRFHFPS